MVRAGCAVLLKTPQSLLTQLTPRGYSDNDMPDPPRLSVCMPGEPCGYVGNCNHWRTRLSQMGHQVVCADRTVRKGTLFIFPGLVGTLKLVEKFELAPLYQGPRASVPPVARRARHQRAGARDTPSCRPAGS